MNETSQKEYRNLVDLWNRSFCMTDEDETPSGGEPLPEDAWKGLAPSEKLLMAAQSLKDCQNALDYGSGSGWGGIIIARSGCPRVTCADPAPNARDMAAYYAKLFGVDGRVHPVCISETWLSETPGGTYDGFFCSNVLDVVPPEMAEDILRHAARVVTAGGRAVVGLNFYMTPEAAEKRGVVFQDGNRLYMDGVLRLVNRTDGEWTELLGRYFRVDRLEHFAWPGEEKETRRLFYLRAKEEESC